MARRIGKYTIAFDNSPEICGYAAVVGKKEGNGPLKGCFDVIKQDAKCNQKSWELAESKMQQTAITTAMQKSNYKFSDIDVIIAGDLLNQCIGSTFACLNSNKPFLGLYGACSTMAESLLTGACLIDAGSANKIIAAASSHFCSAERQYRFPLAYGGQRPPTAQWTATAAGAAVLEKTNNNHFCITHAIIGKMVEMGIKDANNMGAAMAPAAFDTIYNLFNDTNTKPNDYDIIVTGDLGDLGATLLVDLFNENRIDITRVYSDCGSMLYGDTQDVHSGGSGCGCSAAVLCGHLLDEMLNKNLKKLIFAGTGALMSPTSIQQGQPIVGICHAVVIERKE